MTLFGLVYKILILFFCINGGRMCNCQVDLRHRQVSKSVENVQKIINDLTAEVSSKDARFQSIANSGVHNASLKVILHVGFLSMQIVTFNYGCFCNIIIPLVSIIRFRTRRL